MSFLLTLSEYVKTGIISQQSAFLAQLIESGIRTKDQLAECIGKTIRTVERQLKELYTAGVIHNEGELITVATNLSLDQTLKTSIYLNNIDSIDENDEVNRIASSFRCSPQRIRQAMRNAGVEDIELAKSAAKVTLERKPRSLVGYFCRVLQNMKRATGEVCEEVPYIWQDICSRVKDHLSKYSYELFFQRAKCVKKQGELYLKGQNVREMWACYGDLLSKFGIKGVLAGDMRQFAV